mmetsp:Transcript_26193/g.46716  ORF Transcript_26193/g.46716 Transcript_26193/m.46716 type:complete len:376 (-) Transcript_26193:372-1499(-)
MKATRIRVGGKYVLQRKIGSGSFGTVFKATDTSNSNRVAVKLESVKVKSQQLSNEAGVLRAMQGATGYPQVFWYGTEGNYNILVTELLGESLEKVKQKLHTLSLKTVVQCALQLLVRLRTMQERCYIHRDLKPENMVLGLSNAKLIYMIDFGLSRRYSDPSTKQHIPYKENKQIVGTVRYASINNHLGVEQSRRDELESLAYILIYFINGSLPWQGINEKNKRARFCMIGEYKRSESIRSLCQGLPEQFADLLEYSRSLRFEEAPNFDFLVSIFNDLAQQLDVKVGDFDWNCKLSRRDSTRASTAMNTSNSPPERRRSRRSPKSKLRSFTLSSSKKRRAESIETIKADAKPFFKDRRSLMEQLAGAEPDSPCCLF